MKLTKFQHACFVIEKNDISIVVDPGSFTHDFIIPKNVATVCITHNHGDHLDAQKVITILRENPKAVLLAHESILNDFKNEHTQAVSAGETVDANGISLKFVGGAHEQIDISLPDSINLGVIIEGRLYYPGDSYYVPEDAISELLLPISAPWLKIGDAMNLLRALKPSSAFPTHDAILTEEGQSLLDTIVSNIASEIGVNYQRINSETIEL